VTSNTYCPTSHPEIVLSRHFYGSDLGCDCLGIYSQWITGQNSMNQGEDCSYNQTRYGCLQATPITPVRQAQINNLRVCGSANATKFLDITRPEKNGNSFKCPTGTYACSNFTNATNTVCQTNTSMSLCPITDMQIVKNGVGTAFNMNKNVTTSPLYTYVNYTNGVSIVSSTQANSMPITTYQVGIKPCMNMMDQEGRYFYGLEVQQNTICPIEINSELSYDPRYIKQSSSAFQTNEYAVQ